MESWIPIDLIEESLPDSLKELRDYVLKTRNEDITIDLHVFDERVWLYLYLPEEDKRKISWSVIGTKDTGINEKLDKKAIAAIRKVKEHFLKGWLEIQLWDRGDHKEQKTYSIPLQLNFPDRGQFYYNEPSEISMNDMRRFHQKKFYKGKQSVPNSLKGSKLLKKSISRYIFVTPDLRDHYYEDEEDTMNIYFQEFPPLQNSMATITCDNKTESRHSKIANYNSWQVYLHAINSDKGKRMNTKETIFEQIKRLQKEADKEETEIPTKIKEIISTLSTEKRFSELSSQEKKMIQESSQKSPKILVETKIAQLLYLRKKKFQAYDRYIQLEEKRIHNRIKHFIILLIESLKSIWSEIFDNRIVLQKKYQAGLAFAFSILLLMFWWLHEPTQTPQPIDTIPHIANQPIEKDDSTKLNYSLEQSIYKTIQVIQKSDIQKLSGYLLPWEKNQSYYGISESIRNNHYNRAFAAGLYHAEQSIFNNQYSEKYPLFLFPDTKQKENLSLDLWLETQWSSFYQLGRWCYLIQILCVSDIELQTNFWIKQADFIETIKHHIKGLNKRQTTFINARFCEISKRLMNWDNEYYTSEQRQLSDEITALVDNLSSVTINK